MIFSELYSAYYNAVAEILREAASRPLDSRSISRICESYAFDESSINISKALKEERWQLLDRTGRSVLLDVPDLPLTVLQKRWLKAISLDPRVRLFGDAFPDFPEVEPLFTPDDYVLFDKYNDGDDFTDEGYIQRFRLILDAIRRQYPLVIELLSSKNRLIRCTVVPKYLEYSEKDDKFRLIVTGHFAGNLINLGSIISCKPYELTAEQALQLQNNPSGFPAQMEVLQSTSSGSAALTGRPDGIGSSLIPSGTAGVSSGRAIPEGNAGPDKPVQKKWLSERFNDKHKAPPGKVIFELTDERNALERVLLHFAHFEKQAEKLGDKKYKVTILYDARDETEILIRILSFGPKIRVIEPDSFIELIRKRLQQQYAETH